AMVTGVKNPVLLAHEVMNQTNHVLLAGPEAAEFAKSAGLELKPPEYFKTKHREEEFLKTKKTTRDKKMKQPIKGTVGAVALDQEGNLAAATTTGGTSGKLPGRIGDSCIIGAGCFADNRSCAVSGTGDGEFLITGVLAHTIAMMVELKGMPLQTACKEAVFRRNSHMEADLGVISINQQGETGIAHNSERMHRAWINTAGEVFCEVI